MHYTSSSAVITGASQGIGREIALAFASETNHPLLLISRNREKLLETQQLCKEAGASEAEIVTCDLSDREQTRSLAIPANIPPPGILINNAGSFLLKELHETTYPEFNRQIQDNLFTAVNITDRFMEEFKSSDRALIVNICSASSLEGRSESGAYAASKHALLGYSRSLRLELMNTNIGVTAINLGQTHSTSWEGSSINRELLIDPKDVAHLIIALTRFSPRTLAEEITLSPQHGRVPPM